MHNFFVFLFVHACLSFCWHGSLFLFHGQTFSVFLYHAPKGRNNRPVRIFYLTKILREILIKTAKHLVQYKINDSNPPNMNQDSETSFL